MAESERAERTRQPGHARLRIGKFAGVALHDGTVQRERPAGFVRNAEEAEVERAFAMIGLPADALTLTFTGLALESAETGLVLFDTGNGPGAPATAGRLAENLAAAGHGRDEVAAVVVSHFHADHIAGLLDGEGRPAFPAARILVPEPEWAYWTDKDNRAAAPEAQHRIFELTERVFGVLGERTERFAWGDEILPGIAAVQADGHTPGHTAFDIRSDGQRMLYVGDITNNPLIFARNPDWQAAFDILPDRAVETRRRLLDMAAAERLHLFFFHAPFPSHGYVAKVGERYEYLPAFWSADA